MIEHASLVGLLMLVDLVNDCVGYFDGSRRYWWGAEVGFQYIWWIYYGIWYDTKLHIEKEIGVNWITLGLVTILIKLTCF